MEITSHVAQNDTNRRSGVDYRTTRHAGYQVSQKKRKRIEEVFGWMKGIGLLRKLRHRGLASVGCSPSRQRLTTWRASAT